MYNYKKITFYLFSYIFLSHTSVLKAFEVLLIIKKLVYMADDKLNKN
jgi:hypothetical protein|tara:strand:+ start:289 stop:429 length:141 start_codon:yes stop_codon:yes gene_type:complete